MDIDSVAISSSAGYHFFRSRQGSETTTVFDGLLYKKRKEQFEHILRVYEHWEVNDNEILSTIYGYYASRLVQCVQEISISDGECKRILIRKILDDDLSNKAFKAGKINSKLLSIISIPIKHKNITGCIVMGKLVGNIKNSMNYVVVCIAMFVGGFYIALYVSKYLLRKTKILKKIFLGI